MLPEGLQFASRFDHVTGSAIREIFKVLTRPNMISFAGGSPSAEALPDRECAEIARQVLLDDGKRILQYGATEGYPPFVESLISYLKEHYGFEATPATVLPTTGSTSCMDLLCKAFINPGDTVLVESPTFLGNMQTLRLYEANLVSIPSDDDGVRIDALEEAAKRHHPKLFYVIPCFQNPSGRTLSLERRQQIAELAAKYHFLVMEDDPYRDIRYSGEDLPPIKCFDTVGNVVVANSFSKIFSPGVRLGYVMAEPETIHYLTEAKSATNSHTSMLPQVLCAEFFKRGYYPAHHKMLCDLYRQRRDAMLECIDKYFPEGTKHSFPDGGLFTWVELPGDIDTAELLKESSTDPEVGVAFVAGAGFFVGGSGAGRNCMRMSFGNNSPEKIREGVMKLGKLIEKKLAQQSK